jgi:hypothetical protein
VAHAAPKLSITSSSVLDALPVGHAVTFHVELSDLAVGQELDFLAATVNYTGALLGPPTITKGGILPQPLADPADFTFDAAAGLADASFLTFSPDSAAHISTNGVFFSFDAQVLKAGAGSLSLTYVDASLSPNTPEDVTAGAALNFRAVDVPEPAAWLLVATAAIAAFPYVVLRRVQRSRHTPCADGCGPYPESLAPRDKEGYNHVWSPSLEENCNTRPSAFGKALLPPAGF